MSISIRGMLAVTFVVAVFLALYNTRVEVDFIGELPNVLSEGTAIALHKDRLTNEHKTFKCELIRYKESGAFTVRMRLIDRLQLSARQEYSLMGPELTFYPTFAVMLKH